MTIELYSFNLKCSACGATGTANATDNDNGPNFQMRSVPEGFKHSAYSPNPWKQAFQHECGGQVEFEIT